MQNDNRGPNGYVTVTANLIGNKWKMLIINVLLERTYRFGELKNALSGISQKVLTANLRCLENDGLVNRAIYAEVPPRVEYSLSTLGKTLAPVMDSMNKWGSEYESIYADNG